LVYLGPPKCKLFAWLILQDRVWTSDRLARRNWDHSPSCPLCRRTMETSLHMVCECRYTRRIWATAAAWTGLRHPHPGEWPQNESVLQWWSNVITPPDIPHKGTRSIVLLVLWEVWLGRNDRVFNHHESSIPSIVAKIKTEISAWVAAGARDLAILTTRM
jgi:hypothetical protein